MSRLPLVVLLAALLAGCGLPAADFEPREGAVEVSHAVLAEPRGWPEPLRDGWTATRGGVVVASSPEEVEGFWQDPLSGRPPTRFLDAGVIVFVGVVEEAACPLRVFTVDTIPDREDVGIHTHYPRLAAIECGRETIPRTFVIAIPEAAVGMSPSPIVVIRPDGTEQELSR